MNNYGLIVAALILAAAGVLAHGDQLLCWLMLMAAVFVYLRKIDVSPPPASPPDRSIEDLLNK